MGGSLTLSLKGVGLK